jgi:hypothetical protein
MSNKSKVDTEIVNRLKSQLPRGYSNVIAGHFNVSRQYVSHVINSGKISHPIWDMAIILMDREQKKTAKKKQKACQLLNI